MSDLDVYNYLREKVYIIAFAYSGAPDKQDYKAASRNFQFQSPDPHFISAWVVKGFGNGREKNGISIAITAITKTATQ